MSAQPSPAQGHAVDTQLGSSLVEKALGIQGEQEPAGGGRGSCPSAQHWGGHARSTGSGAGLLTSREQQAYFRESKEGHGEADAWSISAVRRG